MDDPSAPQAISCARRARTPFFEPQQSRVRCAVELAVVFGGFIGGWILVARAGEQWLNGRVHWQIFIQGGVVLFLVALVTALGPSSVQNLGLSRGHLLREIGIGVLSFVPVYAVAVAITVLVMLVMWFVPGGQTMESMYQSKKPMIDAVSELSAVVVLPLAAFVGMYEEVLFRGFLLGRLGALSSNRMLAVAFSALAFGCMHYPSQGWLGVLQTTCIGAMLAGLTLWRRSLWAAMTCHALIDVAGIAGVLLLQQFGFLQRAGGG